MAHVDLADDYRKAGIAPPVNRAGPDLLLRPLDCEVLRALHQTRADAGVVPFDTVRAAFTEGPPLYDNAGFRAKTHIQLCVRTPATIRGYFRPLGDDGRPMQFDGDQ